LVNKKEKNGLKTQTPSSSSFPGFSIHIQYPADNLIYTEAGSIQQTRIFALLQRRRGTTTVTLIARPKRLDQVCDTSIYSLLHQLLMAPERTLRQEK